MAKLTRKQTEALQATLYHLKRAEKYIHDPLTAVTRRCSVATTTLHYTRADGSVLYEVDREIGSDLTGLREGIRRLERFLSGPTGEEV